MRRLRGTLTVMAHARGQRGAPFMPRERMEKQRDSRIRRIVKHAARTVPYYRDLFARIGVDPREIRGAKELDELPLLDPEAVRADPTLFLSRSRHGRDGLTLTSGSIGKRPLELRHDRGSLLANIAFGERERSVVIELCGGSFRPREVHIGYEGSNFKKVLRFYAENTRMPKPLRDQLLMVAPFDELVAAINSVRPDVLTAYGGFLDVFFRTVVARGVDVHAPKVVMYMGEALPPDRREWIERELGSLVLSRYVATESFKIGYFCEQRTGFHLHDDLCHLRVLGEDGRDLGPDQPGQIVISNLVNYASVLLNYPMGDVAALSGRGCTCGRTHRLLSEIQGRVEDMLPLPNGEHLHPREVWSVFKDDRGVLQYQLIQHEIRRFELKLVTTDEPAFAQSRERALRQLRSRLGCDAEIEVTSHAELGRAERGRRGKFKAVETRVAATTPG